MASYWDEDLAILSAENVSFSIEAAGLGSRLSALFIDTLLQGIIALLAHLAFDGLFTYVVSWGSLSPLVQSVFQGIGILVSFVFYFGYFFLFEWLWEGQTPGKRSLGLRVTQANGLPLTFWGALVRNLVRVVDFLPVFYGIGGVVAMTNSLSQRAGDFAAGTIVVREGRREKITQTMTMREAIDRFLSAATTVSVAPPESRDWDGEAYARFDEEAVPMQTAVDPEALSLAKRLTREDYELARDFGARCEKLPLEARRRLAYSLANRLANKAGMAPPTQPEEFIRQIAITLSPIYAG